MEPQSGSIPLAPGVSPGPAYLKSFHFYERFA
jgi:hypothetical protein